MSGNFWRWWYSAHKKKFDIVDVQGSVGDDLWAHLYEWDGVVVVTTEVTTPCCQIPWMGALMADHAKTHPFRRWAFPSTVWNIAKTRLSENQLLRSISRLFLRL